MSKTECAEKKLNMPGLKEDVQDWCLSHKRPVARREYDALKLFIGVNLAYGQILQNLEPRLKEAIPHGWRDAKLLRTVGKRLFDELLLTIPQDKLMILHTEIKHLSIYVRVDGPANWDADEGDHAVIPRSALKTLVEYAAGVSCSMCDKKGKDARKCKLRRILKDALAYDTPETVGADESCPYTSYSIDDVEWE